MIIYKYLDEDSAIKTIRKNSVLLKEPVEFNDPFDSIFRVEDEEKRKAYDLFINYEFFKKTYEDLIINGKKANRLGKIIKKSIMLDAANIRKCCIYKKNICLEKSYKYALNVFNKDDSGIQNKFEEMIDFVLSHIRQIALISCFGSSFDSILMWSHYSNKHKGACIEFEIDDQNFEKVFYYKKPVLFKLTDAISVICGHEFANKIIDTNNPEFHFLLDPILAKSEIWHYEGETRCVFPKYISNPLIYEIEEDGEKKTLLQMPKIKKIFLGCKADDDFISKVKEVSKDIPIYKMECLPFGYGLEAKEMVE